MNQDDVERLERLLDVQDNHLEYLRNALNECNQANEALQNRNKQLVRERDELFQATVASSKDIESSKLQKLVDDNQLTEQLSRQGASLLSLANKHIELRERRIYGLEFQAQIDEKAITDLQDHVNEQSKMLLKLTEANKELLSYKEAFEIRTQSSTARFVTNADKTAKLNSSLLSELQQEKLMLESKLASLEHNLLEKDREMLKLHEKINSIDDEIKPYKDAISNLNFDLSLAGYKVMDVETDCNNRIMQMTEKFNKTTREIESRFEDQIHQLEMEKRQALEEKKKELATSITLLERKIESANCTISQKNAEICRLEETISRFQIQIGELRSNEIASNEMTTEINVLRSTVAELKHLVSQKDSLIEKLQIDAMTHHNTQLLLAAKEKDMSKCKIEILKLRGEIGKQHTALAIKNSHESDQNTEILGNISRTTQDLQAVRTANSFKPEKQDLISMEIGRYLTEYKVDVSNCPIVKSRNTGEYIIGSTKCYVLYLNGQLIVDAAGIKIPFGEFLWHEQCKFNLGRTYQSQPTKKYSGPPPPCLGSSVNPFSFLVSKVPPHQYFNSFPRFR